MTQAAADHAKLALASTAPPRTVVEDLSCGGPPQRGGCRDRAFPDALPTELHGVYGFRQASRSTRRLGPTHAYWVRYLAQTVGHSVTGRRTGARKGGTDMKGRRGFKLLVLGWGMALSAIWAANAVSGTYVG